MHNLCVATCTSGCQHHRRFQIDRKEMQRHRCVLQLIVTTRPERNFLPSLGLLRLSNDSLHYLISRFVPRLCFLTSCASAFSHLGISFIMLFIIFLFCLFFFPVSRRSCRGVVPPLLSGWSEVHQRCRWAEPQQGRARDLPRPAAGRKTDRQTHVRKSTLSSCDILFIYGDWKYDDESLFCFKRLT